jgi:anti-anti-sigma factor
MPASSSTPDGAFGARRSAPADGTRPAFEAHLALDHDCVRIVLRGEFGLAATPKFEAFFSSAANAWRPTIVIDISGVTCCDAHGAGALKRARACCLAKGTTLRVVGASGDVQRVLGPALAEDVLA